jgi:P27 family predicted phage terminase small subunit
MPGGRPPVPTALKVVRGNPGKRALNTAEPQYSADHLACPRWLSAEAKREWRRVAKLLKDQRVVTDADRAALVAYCQAWARWRQAEEILETGGFTQQVAIQNAKGEIIGEKEIVRPEVIIAQKYLELMQRAAGRLGLDPSSRAKVSKLPEAHEDPFAQFLRGGGQKGKQSSG